MANLNMARLSAYPVFLAVYEERRLVKAAERLCVTPSAVSHALRDFERRLGVKLFERTSEGLQPTASGKQLYATVKPHLVVIEAAERELISGTAAEQTDFAFASFHTFIKAFFCSDSRADAEGRRASKGAILDPIHGGNSQGGGR